MRKTRSIRKEPVATDPAGTYRQAVQPRFDERQTMQELARALREADWFFVVADASGRLLQTGGRLSTMLGTTATSLRGAYITEVLPDLAEPMARALADQSHSIEAQVMARGRPHLCRIHPLLNADAADGAPPAAAMAWCEPQAAVTRAIGGLDAVRGLAKELESIIEASSDGIWVCDGQGVIVRINAASERLNNIRSADFTGRSVRAIIESGLVDRSVTLEVLEEKQRVSLIQHVTATGRRLLVTGTPAFDENGEIALVVVNERDITELDDLRESLEQVRRTQEKFRTKLVELSVLELGRKEIVAESDAMTRVLAAALKLAQLDASHILVLGESGVGKGLIAKFIHKHSPRSHKPFIHINCPAIPENLFEAELFGYVEGAFTGARASGKAGQIELAEGGTLFLDEIGDIPLNVQAKLLKYLDDFELARLGDERSRRVECTVIAATNRDLDALVAQKKFRKDLYYRLNAFTVKIPPLRERAEDILELARFYLDHFNAKYGTAKRLSPRARRLLMEHAFPGNVRELVAVIQKAVAMGEEEKLDEAVEEALRGDVARRSPGRPGTGGGMAQEVAEAERRALKRAMAACASTRAMARYLGISQASVVRKLKRHNLA